MALKDPPIEVAQSVPSTQDKFFPHEAISADLWDKYTPFQLLLVEASDPDPESGAVTYTATPLRYTLPIPPQELSLDMPIPVNMQATLTGMSAQHGGAPFKNIMLQGTTGISPLKNRGSQLRQAGVVESIFAGAIQDLGRARTAAQKLVNGQETNSNVNAGLGTTVDDPNRILETSTGYYQMRLMERFIESYVQIKASGSSVLVPDDQPDLLVPRHKVRMAFCMWKDQSVYLVEPLQFTKKRSASSPMEYMFNLQLRAYKRIQLSGGLTGRSPHEFAARKPSAIANIFNRFRAARELLSALTDVFESVISDPVNLLTEALRETNLFLAEIAGTKAALADFPEDVNDEAFASIGAQWRQLRTRFQSLVSPETDSALLNNRTLTSDQKQELKEKVAPKLGPDSLRLPSVTRKKIANEIERVKNLGRADFEKTRDLTVKTASDFADRIGAGNATFSEIFNRTTPTESREPTATEMDVLFILNELAIQLDHLAVSSQIDPPVPTSIEYVAGLAEASGVAFKVPRSKLAVPFPYGMTLERLAQIYLGDANRWHEIATLNGLRAPYVDEVGFKLLLLTNGDRNTVNVSDASKLFQGQTVWLSANGVRREKRHIYRIVTISSTQYVVTLDGEADLEKFTTMGQAQLEAFLPATVNSQQIIYIPSQNESPEDPRTKQVPGVNEFDGLLQVSGIDLLLTPSGDLAITPDGDCRLAFGLANIVQTVKIALGTPRGSLLQHPEYGLALPVGASTADVDANEILKAAKEMFARDPMFSGVRSALVMKDGPVLKITLEVGIAGTSQFVPITIPILS